MKLSCLPVSFFSEIISGQMSVGEWARLGADLGLDAIDLSILFVDGRQQTLSCPSPCRGGVRGEVGDELLSEQLRANVAAMRGEIEAAGMRVAMVTSYPDFTHPDPTQRARELDLEIEVVEIARELGAEMVRVTAGQAHPNLQRSTGIRWAVEGLSHLAAYTSDSGKRSSISPIHLVYENHAKPAAWQYTDFSQPPDIFLEIVHQTAGCGLGINFDTGNAATFATDPLALLESVVERVVSIHASDSSTCGVLNHTLLGTGITPFHELFACLKRHGWDGWICMEEASYQGRTGMERAAAFIRKTWQEA